jgi:hypothetical protein
MKRFGQEVFLTIENSDGTPILDAAGLRIDFDVRQQPGFNRASITIYNLNEETIGNLIGGNQDHYVTLRTTLHGQNEFILMDSYYISNVVDHKELPDTYTTIFCYSRLKKELLEVQVDTFARDGALNTQLKAIKSATDFEGGFRLKRFPEDYAAFIPPSKACSLSGSVSTIMDRLGKEHNFKWYCSETGDLVLSFMPDSKQIALTSLDTDQFITLDTNNMRSNPKLAPAQLQINSNLDGSIVPTAIVDITQLLTAQIGSDPLTLQVATDFAQQAISGYKRYSVVEVRHSGSNYTGEWNSRATCVSPKTGATMPVGNTTWFRDNIK